MKKILVAVFAGALLGATTVIAEQSATPPSDTKSSGYLTLDENHDGVISNKEAAKSPKLSKSWGKVDINGDGVIDQSEIGAIDESGKSEEKQM